MIRLLLTLVFVGCFSLATCLDPLLKGLHPQSNDNSSVIGALMGESRRLFANQLFVEADVYFHSGYYPSMFDATESDLDVNEGPAADADNHSKLVNGRLHVEEGEGFFGRPRDWLDSFGRHFYPTEHTHLANANIREILPWLRLSADMDPHRIQTYLTASYWLRGTLDEPDEAIRFLHEGLRANPDSFEILLELGYVYDLNKKNPGAARNVLEAALKKWKEQDAAGLNPPPKARVEILDGLVRVDKEQNDVKQMLADLEALAEVSPNREAIEKTIQETRAQLAAPAPVRPN
jgi:tetratricopeptide (TPR) repeat protein